MASSFAISTHGLTKRFDRHIAVNDIDLQIRSGDVFGLIGPNGAGKTTLIRMLAAAEEPTLGDIYINGERLYHDAAGHPRRDRAQQHIKQSIGYLPDDFPLYDDLTVWDYLDYFARLYRLTNPRRDRRICEVLELVQLSHKRRSLIKSLSRGMKQRLSLARTIIHEPVVLLLDEPVSGLDPIARQQFRDIIRVLQAAGMTILISSHVLSDLAELCSAIGIMELGFLVESASLADLYQRLSTGYILLTTLGDRAEVEAALRGSNLVGNVEPLTEPGRFKVQFSGTPEDSANLLRSLVESGLPLTEFQLAQDDLETIFLRLGHQQSF